MTLRGKEQRIGMRISHKLRLQNPHTRSSPMKATLSKQQANVSIVSAESLGQPQPLEELLSNVWKSIGAATDAMNALIGSLRAYAASDRPKSGKNLPIADVAVTMAFSLNVMARFAEAMVTITVARGYIFPRVACKNTFEQHLAMLDCRDSKLREVEEGLVKTLEDAQPLLEARRTFLEVEASMRRRRLGRIAIRSAAMVLLPFVPTVSAALTAIDTLLIMAWYGIEGVDVSEEDLRSTSATVENLLKEIDEKLTSVRGQRKDLVAIRAKVTAQRDDPATQRLYKLLVKLYEAYELAQSVFAFGSKADGTAGEPAPDQVSVSTATTLEPVSASADPLISASSSSAVIDTTHGIKDKSLQAVYGDLREVLQALGEPPKSAPLLYEVEDSEWAILNETLAATRAVKLDELLSRDRAAAAAAQ
ncbi:hypothetical protein C8Q77DRAFT_1162326 [Trametes polyzona]|nr:hypothetical protein C8Q77DRAFT_1162326 [Trametes polyzona]